MTQEALEKANKLNETIKLIQSQLNSVHNMQGQLFPVTLYSYNEIRIELNKGILKDSDVCIQVLLLVETALEKALDNAQSALEDL